MKNILTLMEENIVERHNTLRFKCASSFDLVLKSDIDHLEKLQFLRAIFDWKLAILKEVLERIKQETFLEITNDLNIRGLL